MSEPELRASEREVNSDSSAQAWVRDVQASPAPSFDGLSPQGVTEPLSEVWNYLSKH